MRCCPCLEFLMVLSLNLGFVIEVWQDIRACLRVEKLSTVWVSTVPCHLIPLKSSQCPRSTDFWWTCDTWEFSETQSACKVSVLCIWLTFHLNQNLLWMQKEGSGILRNMNVREPYHFLILFLCISQPLMLRRKGHQQKPFFPLSVLSYSSVNRKQRLLQYAQIEKWNKTTWVHVLPRCQCSGTKEIYICMSELQNTNCVILAIQHMN